MTGVETPLPAAPPTRLNVADRLSQVAAARPAQIAVACPRRWSSNYTVSHRTDSGATYSTITFEELDADATRIAAGLLRWGVPPGTRLALLVRPGIEFVTLVFALLRAGMVIILIDPGLGRRNLIRCLAAAKPEGVVAIPAAHAARVLLRHKFPTARWNVTVGRRWFWGGLTLNQLRNRTKKLPTPHSPLPTTTPDDPAAVIFTSGSTGPPKGVLYTHRMFDTQVAEIQSLYGIEPGGTDLACFPLFALFNSAMGVTTVLPEMDFSRPAAADPKKLLAAARDWQVTQAFASPAVWRAVGQHCAKTGERIPSLRQVFSCGAPVTANVLRSTLACIADGAKMHTPYGATECLPVATIEADKVLHETASRTDEGAGICVGSKFDSIDWRIIRITDDPMENIDEADELPPGEIGELIVRGPQTSPQYVTRPESNALAKISNSQTDASSTSVATNERAGASSPPAWHRMGDVGYLDEKRRFWYCGRKSHRVVTASGTLYTECVEAIVNTHPGVARSALVGLGDRGSQIPVVIVEPTDELYEIGDTWWEHPEYLRVIEELKSMAKINRTRCQIDTFLFSIHLPVDIRHNAKINRELLARWAAEELPELG